MAAFTSPYEVRRQVVPDLRSSGTEGSVAQVGPHNSLIVLKMLLNAKQSDV